MPSEGLTSLLSCYSRLPGHSLLLGTFLSSFDKPEPIFIVGFRESAWKNNVSHYLYSAFPLYPMDTAQTPGSIIIVLML